VHHVGVFMIIHVQIRMCQGEAGGRSTGILRMLVTAEVIEPLLLALGRCSRVRSGPHWMLPVAGMTGWYTKPCGVFTMFAFSATPAPSQFGSNKRTSDRKISILVTSRFACMNIEQCLQIYRWSDLFLLPSILQQHSA
jgi:hypothetical protein